MIAAARQQNGVLKPWEQLRIRLSSFRAGLVVLQLGLLGISFWMTFRGLSDFAAVRLAADGDYAGVGILLVVLMLTVSMYTVLLLALRPGVWFRRAIAGLLYVWLAAFSIGFGYGFWWSLLAGQDVTKFAFSTATDQLERDIASVERQLGSIESEVHRTALLSLDKAEKEMREGGTCDDGYKQPKCGERCEFRQRVAADLEDVADRIRQSWICPILIASGGSASNCTTVPNVSSTLSVRQLVDRARGATTVEQRREGYRNANLAAHKLADTIREHYASHSASFATELRDIGAQFRADIATGVQCRDRQLESRIATAADRTGAPIVVSFKNVPFVEGKDATAAAIEVLWRSLLTSVVDLIRSTGSLFDQPSKESASKENAQAITSPTDAVFAQYGGGRNVAALIAALGVDMSLFVLAFIAVGRPFDSFENLTDPTRGNEDKLLRMFATLVARNGIEGIPFWRQCLICADSQSFLVNPDPTTAPAAMADHAESVQAIAGTIVETRGLPIAHHWRFQRARAMALARLSSWGWENPNDGDFRLVPLRRGELLQIHFCLRQLELELVPGESSIEDSDKPEDRRQLRRWRELLEKHLPIGIGNRRHTTGETATAEPHGAFSPELPTADTHENKLVLAAETGPTGAPPASDESKPGMYDAEEQHHAIEEPQATETAPATPDGTTNPVPQRTGFTEPETTQTADVEPSDMLPVLDNLEFMLKAAEDQRQATDKENSGDLRELDELSALVLDIAQKHDLERINKTGVPFDPNIHHAIEMRPSETQQGNVLQILRSGYRHNGKLLRAALAVVSDGPEGIADTKGLETSQSDDGSNGGGHGVADRS